MRELSSRKEGPTCWCIELVFCEHASRILYSPSLSLPHTTWPSSWQTMVGQCLREAQPRWTCKMVRLPSTLPPFLLALDVVHTGFVCDRCGINPIRGIRWKCANCADCTSLDAQLLPYVSHALLFSPAPLLSKTTVSLRFGLPIRSQFYSRLVFRFAKQSPLYLSFLI